MTEQTEPFTVPDSVWVSPWPQPIVTIDGETAPLVTIHTDGTLEYGEDYTPDEAARQFWDALRRYAPQQFRRPAVQALEDERDRARRWAVSLENENRRLTDQVREAKEHARVAMVAALNLQRQTPEAAQSTLGRIREARTWSAVWVELGQYFGLSAEQAGVEARSRRLGDSL